MFPKWKYVYIFCVAPSRGKTLPEIPGVWLSVFKERAVGDFYERIHPQIAGLEKQALSRPVRLN